MSTLWRSWFRYKQGKEKTRALEYFMYHAENELYRLHEDIIHYTYRHGSYQQHVITDTKRRTISTAPLRDRVVHRLLYDYLVSVFDKTFIYDAWSCRAGKGLLGAITRIQRFYNRFPRSVVWRADIRKCFEGIDHEVLRTLIAKRVYDPLCLWLINSVIDSYHITQVSTRERERERVLCRFADARHAHRQSHQPNFFQYLPQ